MVRVYDLAHCRAGDKGNTSNISVVAYNEAAWRVLYEQLTPQRVQDAFGHIAKGPVRRYELPNLRALNFILHNSLAGGGSGSMRTDAQGKTFGRGLLFMEIEVPDNFAG